MRDKNIAIIINKNCGEIIIRCINKLQKSKTIQRIITVDNNSSDNSISLTRKRFPDVKIIERKKNLGYAGGINIGLKLALRFKPSSITIINPDVLIKKNTIKNLLKVLWSKERIGIVGSKILNKKNKVWFGGGEINPKRWSATHYQNDRIKNTSEVDFITGSLMIVKAEIFNKVGFFDDQFFLYYEDIDFCQRVRNHGYKAVYVSRTTAIHHESTSVKKFYGMKEYYLARNHLVFLFKHAPNSIKLRELIRLPKTLIEFVKCDEKSKYKIKGIIDFLIGKRGKSEYWS